MNNKRLGKSVLSIVLDANMLVKIVMAAASITIFNYLFSWRIKKGMILRGTSIQTRRSP